MGNGQAAAPTLAMERRRCADESPLVDELGGLDIASLLLQKACNKLIGAKEK